MRQSNHKTRFQGGLSLIELMISITLGLLILVSLTTMFVNESKSRVELDKSNRMIDNGRYAMELLSSNLELAGFYDSLGINTLSGNPVGIHDPCDTASLTNSASNLDILRLAVQGYNATLNATPIPTSTVTNSAGAAVPPCSTTLTYTSGTLGSIKKGTDILTVRRANTSSIPVASAVNGTIYLQVSMCGTDPTPPLYQVVTAPATFTNFHQVNHAAAPAVPAACATASNAVLRQFMVTTYFISPDDDPAGSFSGTRPAGCTGDCIPTLKQIDQDGNIMPLVEGIEYMHIQYGIDGFGGGAATSYTDCAACTLTDWSNVVSVRINLLARNTEQTKGQDDSKKYVLGGTTAGDPVFTVGPFHDAYKRHVYTQLIRLENPSGRRDKP